MPYDGGIGHGIAIFVTRQDGPLVEAESIHVHLFDPEFQAIRNQLIDKGMVAFEGIAGATIIEIILFIVWHKQIIGTVIYAPVTDGRTQFIALAGVSEDDIQNDLDARFVQSLDHLAKVPEVAPLARCKTVGVVRGEVANGVISPEVFQRSAIHGAEPADTLLIKGKDGQQFNSRDAQLLEVGNLLDDACKGARMLAARGRRPREATNMHFVNDAFAHWPVQRLIALPIKCRGIYNRAAHSCAYIVICRASSCATP